MQITRYGVQIGLVTLSFFGLILITAMAVGWYVAQHEAKRRGQDAGLVVDVLTWGLILGVVVGRLFYILNPPPSVAVIYDRRWYLLHPFDLQVGPLAIWSGGLGMAGVLVGAVLGAVFVLRRRRADLRLWADILVKGLLAGLVVAPFANLVNEQMIGPPTTLPWGMTIQRRLPPYDDLALYPPDTRFHPTPAYLSLWALATLVIIWWVERRWAARLRTGDLFLLATAIYASGLFAADFLRVDMSRSLLGLTGMQVLALLIVIAAAIVLVLRLARGGLAVSQSGREG
jgi:phosphatidylglycerol:prolipoprotein diacylglycerol transferase